MGTFQTLGYVDLQRQIDLVYGFSTSITYQRNATQMYAPLSNDFQLLDALSSSFTTRVWFQQGAVPLVEVTVHVQQIPAQVVGLALGGEHVSSYIWQLASRDSGDPLAKVDVRLDRILVGPRLTKDLVGIEIPRGAIADAAIVRPTQVKDSHVPSALPISPDRVVVGILIDVKQKYLQQARRWLTSWRKTMVKTKGILQIPGMETVKVLVCILPGVSNVYKKQLKTDFPFIHIREILPLSFTLPRATPHSNKLRFLEQPECNHQAKKVLSSLQHHDQYDVCIYMDTDILILNSDLFMYIRPEPVLQFRAGRTLWAQTAANDPAWHRMFELAGVVRKGRDAYPLAGHWPNTGIVMFPTSIVPAFLFDWMHYTDKAMQWLRAFEQDVYFTETISFLLTTLMMKNLQYELLPIQANCQLNLPKLDFVRNGYDDSLVRMGDVTVLHYPLNTLFMDLHHVPRSYDSLTVDAFPFLRQVNLRLLWLQDAMSKAMLITRATTSTSEEQQTAELSDRAVIVQLVKVSSVDEFYSFSEETSPQKQCHTFTFTSSSSSSSSFSELLRRVQTETSALSGTADGLRWMDMERDWVDVVSTEDVVEAMEVQTVLPPTVARKENICAGESSIQTSGQQFLQLLLVVS